MITKGNLATERNLDKTFDFYKTSFKHIKQTHYCELKLNNHPFINLYANQKMVIHIINHINVNKRVKLFYMFL